MNYAWDANCDGIEITEEDVDYLMKAIDFSSSSNQTEEQRKIHAEKIQIISSQLPRLIRVDTWKSRPMVSIQSDRNYVPRGNGSSWAEILRKELILMFETISHFVLGVVAIAILHIALTYGLSDKTNDNPKIRFLKTVCFVVLLWLQI